MQRFAQLHERLDQISSRVARAEAVRAYLDVAPAADAAIVRAWIEGTKVERVISRKLLQRWAREVAPVPAWLFDASREVGEDLGETIELLLPEGPAEPREPLGVHAWIERIATLRSATEAVQREAILRWWRELDRRERVVLDKILTGELRFKPTAATATATATASVTATATAPTHTITAILVYAEPAPDRRVSLLTHLTLAVRSGAELVPIAKTSTGLAEDDVRRLDKWIRSHATARYGPVRHVPPEQLFTLGFDAIEPSARHKSGVLVRGPRIVRWLTGVMPDDAATLDQLRALLPA